jgi:hypothetical protein
MVEAAGDLMVARMRYEQEALETLRRLAGDEEVQGRSFVYELPQPGVTQ